jgi:nitroreductase
MATPDTKTSVDFFNIVESRQSIREFDPKVKISKEELTEIIKITTTAPSSWDLQHWKFLIFDDQSKKEQLFPIAYNQQQVIDSSAVIAILGDVEANKNAAEVYGDAVSNGYMPEETKNTLISQIESAYESESFARDEAILNASLSAMQLMLTAKAKGYDTCPMGGFDKGKFVETFNIPSRYIPVMLVSLGKRSKDAHESTRFPVEEVIVWNEF